MNDYYNFFTLVVGNKAYVRVCVCVCVCVYIMCVYKIVSGYFVYILMYTDFSLIILSRPFTVL